MTTAGEEIQRRFEAVRARYESYLKTLFYFKDPQLRASFEAALRQQEQGDLAKGLFCEPAAEFAKGATAGALADEYQ